MRPTLVVNPRSDAAFVAFAERLIHDGAESATALEAALRKQYPRAVVRERGLAHEATTWYVYREGTWVPSPSE
jgi:hypothetical protein